MFVAKQMTSLIRLTSIEHWRKHYRHEKCHKLHTYDLHTKQQSNIDVYKSQ